MTSHIAALEVHCMPLKMLQASGNVEDWDPEESQARMSAELVREARERVAECLDGWETPEDVWLLTEQDLADDWGFVEACLLRALETVDRETLTESA